MGLFTDMVKLCDHFDEVALNMHKRKIDATKSADSDGKETFSFPFHDGMVEIEVK
jgi:hypothetical protein